MLETGIRQLRMASSMTWGRRLSTRNLARLVGDALATIDEFGEPGADVGQLIDGPAVDPDAQRALATSALRRTATRLAARSPFYARRFAAAGITPGELDAESLRAVPVTVKRDLVERGGEFRCAGVAPALATRTTGTTGAPAEVWMSAYELELWSGLGALASVLRGELRPGDVLQVNTSSRATASVHLNAATCRLVGAACRVVGTVPPDESVEALTGGAVTVLLTVPSYLAALVVAARNRGLGPADFALRRINVGGEVLSPSLSEAARQVFGAVEIADNFGMTEVMPVTGRLCSARHLHYDASAGHVEILDLETGAPAEPGRLGTLVITPYYPYRECMPVFRYDTRDVVRRLPDLPLTCEAAALPASSPVLGKADGVLHTGAGTVTTRDIVEAVESLPTCPWPARYRASVEDGRLRLLLPAAAVDRRDPDITRTHLAARGLDAELSVVPDDDAQTLRPVRSDLHETTFVARPA
jgi:phenylacetate-coenzyme A ligase PaaK-like adenylate-forming protein